jgi:hypothetical protein
MKERLMVAGMVAAWFCQMTAASAEVVIAEGEFFTPKDGKGWAVTPMDDSYASHNYGGMWLSQGGCLGAPVEDKDSVAVQTVTIPQAGDYRVWSKYQALPYFNYLHKVEIHQSGKKVYESVYGKTGTDRLWSFSGTSDELWWPWGVDHDTAEAPKAPAKLAAGPAEIRLITVAPEKPAGCRFIDFVVLTTSQEDGYQGYKPYAVGSPFTMEAMAAAKLYMRFKNSSGAAAKLTLARAGHYQPNYGGASQAFPDADVAPGAWSPWFNVGPFCRLVHDEGVTVILKDGGTIPVQVARDAGGTDLVGDVTVANGEAVVIPVDIVWNKGHKVFTSQEHAQKIVGLCKSTWRTNNNGKKPKSILFYGAFNKAAGWVDALKDALGYNTLLPDNYEHASPDGYHQHCHNPTELGDYVNKIPDKSKFKVMSFGDEISLGTINYGDPAMQTKFTAWLKQKGVTDADLGVAVDAAKLADRETNKRVGWYAQMFNEEERFGFYRDLTAKTKALIGPQVETGANYSPHGMPMYYGPIYQWVDIFKHNGMTMFWGEDYIFSVPMPPQIVSWMIATMHCATKYNNQKIHFYVMPHAPGQRADFLRRNLVYSIGAGVNHIDNFWVAPAETFTENFIAWNYTDSFKAIHESIYDTAAVEPIQVGGKFRNGQVAVVLSKATDHNERLTRVPKAQDQFARRCKNAPDQIEQIICRVDAQMTYLALKHAQQGVDLITEDDIVDGILKKYSVVYFLGEWIDHRVPARLESWIKEGGILYASAGVGHFNEFGENEKGLLKVLGLKDASNIRKDLYCIRPLLELPVATPIDTIKMGEASTPAIGMKQVLVPDSAKVVAKWSDGSAAATVNELGKGKAFAVGTLAGCAYMKSGLPVTPWARGGNRAAVCPTQFDPTATLLIRLAVDVKPIDTEVTCSNPYVEGNVIDNTPGTLVTLVNWTLSPAKSVEVSVKMPAAPKSVRAVAAQKPVEFKYADGRVTFMADVADGEFFVLAR